MARPAQLQADRGNPRLKFLDRYVGIPVVATMSLRRRLRRSPPAPGRLDDRRHLPHRRHRRHRRRVGRDARPSARAARRPHRPVRHCEQRRVRPAAGRSRRHRRAPGPQDPDRHPHGAGRGVRRHPRPHRVAALRRGPLDAVGRGVDGGPPHASPVPALRVRRRRRPPARPRDRQRPPPPRPARRGRRGHCRISPCRRARPHRCRRPTWCSTSGPAARTSPSGRGPRSRGARWRRR